MELYINLFRALAALLVCIVSTEVIASRIGTFNSKRKNRWWIYALTLSLMSIGALLYYYI